MSATPEMQVPAEYRELMENNEWTDQDETAWEVMHYARPGDTVLFADRTVPMEVIETGELPEDEKGDSYLDVDQPQGDGTYRVEERYEDGRPKYHSIIGSANDLRWVDRQPPRRELTEDDYERLVENLRRNAVDSFMRMEYDDWSAPVTDVIEQWSDDVARRRWRSYKHHPDWQDGDPAAIFESVSEHAHDEVGGKRVPSGEEVSVRESAESLLYQAVYERGRRLAEETILQAPEDYADLVEKMAHHTLDRFDTSGYTDIRVASRDTVSDWIDDRTEPVLQAVIEYGTMRFDEDTYDDPSIENPTRELAFDILEHDVWEQVQRLQRDRGKHDPTLRGLTYSGYQELVGGLAEQTVKLYDSRGFIRTTAQDVVNDWADSVQAEDWAGHRHRVWTDGDVDDIFSSAAIHATSDPMVFNPFSDDSERKMAVLAVTADVVGEAERIIDERQPVGPTTPADRYIRNTLGLDDKSYSDFAEAHPEDVRETLGRVVEAMDGTEVGWTFVDEIIESGGHVPESTNDWLLIDYGVIHEGETLRKLAWLDRDSGDVLVLSGMATEKPENLDQTENPYKGFHVQVNEWESDEPNFLLTDESLEDALKFVYDYIEADRADIRVIETGDDVMVEDRMTDEDINAGGVFDALIPNMPWGSDDLFTLADAQSRTVADELTYWGPELAKITAYATLAWAPKWAGDRLDGIRVEPNVDKRHGVGANVSKEFGKAPHESGVGGKADIKLNIRPKTFRKLGERYSPKFLQYGFGEGDLGKGAVRRAGEGLDRIREFGTIYNDSTIPEILEKQDELDDMELEELQALADKTNRGYGDAYNDADELSSKLYGYAEYGGTSWGRAFLDEFGGSIEDLEEFVKSSSAEATDGDDEFRWDDFEESDLGVSGMMMRGLSAETLVGSMEFLGIDDWMNNRGTFYPSDYIDPDDVPSYEEWSEERFGPGKPSGPEEEARRLARYHKEVAGADEGPDPFDEYADAEQRAQGDYNNSQYDFDDGFGNEFDAAAEKFAGNEPVESDAEFEDGHE